MKWKCVNMKVFVLFILFMRVHARIRYFANYRYSISLSSQNQLFLQGNLFFFLKTLVNFVQVLVIIITHVHACPEPMKRSLYNGNLTIELM